MNYQVPISLETRKKTTNEIDWLPCKITTFSDVHKRKGKDNLKKL